MVSAGHLERELATCRVGDRPGAGPWAEACSHAFQSAGVAAPLSVAPTDFRPSAAATASTLVRRRYSLSLPTLVILKCSGSFLIREGALRHKPSHFNPGIRSSSFSRMSATLPLPPSTDRATAISFSGASSAHCARSAGLSQSSASGLCLSTNVKDVAGLRCFWPQKSTATTATVLSFMTTFSVSPTTFPIRERLSRTNAPGWILESVTNTTHNQGSS